MITFSRICRAAALPAGLALLTIGLVATSPASPAAASSQATATATAAAVANFPSTNDRCVNQSHTVPCWALTIRSGTFYLRDGTTESIGGNDLVLISCYYIDSAGNVQDHVQAEDAGGDTETGHIPDSNIDLNNHPPYRLQYRPYIGVCH